MKKVVLVVAVILMAGCRIHDSVNQATTQPTAQSEQTSNVVYSQSAGTSAYQSLDAINYLPLKIYDDGIEQTISIRSETDTLALDGNASHVLGWSIPAYGSYQFKLMSKIKRTGFGREASAFVPEVWLLDKQFNVIKTLPANELHYQKPQLMSGEYIYHDFVVDNRDAMLTPVQYIVAVMTDGGREHKIEVIDEMKEYAKVRGTTAPVTADIMATASEKGTIVLRASSAVTSYQSIDKAALHTTSAATMMRERKQTTNAVYFDTVTISQTYREEVQRLLKDGNITKALEMRTVVNTLQSDLQNEFSALYKGGMSGTLMDKNQLEKMPLDRQLPASYQHQMKAYFKADDTRQALALLDQAKALKHHIDSLF